MSGGHFDYKQYEINYIADSIEQAIRNNGRKKTKEELKEGWFNEEHYKQYPEDLFHTKYSDEVMEEFKKGLLILKKAAIYTQRIDWLLSGDDGEESFLERLNEELSKL